MGAYRTTWVHARLDPERRHEPQGSAHRQHPPDGLVGDPIRSGHTGGMESLRVSRSVVVPEKELRWRFSRSSGPGGQSVNTADSRVELSLDLTTTTALGPTLRARALERLDGKLVRGVLTVTASERRSQRQNREAAMKRMAETLAEAIAPPPKKRRPMRVSRGADEKRLAEKHRRAEIKRLRRPDDD